MTNLKQLIADFIEQYYEAVNSSEVVTIELGESVFGLLTDADIVELQREHGVIVKRVG